MAIDVATPDSRPDIPASISSPASAGDGTPERIDVGNGKAVFYPSTSRFDPSCVDRSFVIATILAWYLIGVGAITSTKILLTDWNVPPLLVTFQQLLLASSILRLVIAAKPGEVQPLPWQKKDQSFPSPIAGKLVFIWEHHSDFVLTGLFNGLDFLCSNTAFSASAASFVETIKSSDPITTTAVALAWNVDSLGGSEAVALFLLIVGVLLSTWGNSQSAPQAAEAPSLEDSVKSVTIVVIANFCFAFRAMFQKRYVASAGDNKLDDVNLLCRMQQTGAIALFFPVLINCSGFVFQAITTLSHRALLFYTGISLFNALCYCVYNLASTYILTKLTVLQHSSLNCLRRMFAIVATCVLFGVPISLLSALGLLTSLVGFVAFTYLRNTTGPLQTKVFKPKDSVV